MKDNIGTLKIGNNSGVTDRGNKHLKLLTTYHREQLLKDFKATCAIEGESMTKVVDDAIVAYVEKKKKK